MSLSKLYSQPLLWLVCAVLLSTVGMAQSPATTEFCNWQQAAFLNANMNNVAIFNLKQFALLGCQGMTDQDALAAAQADIASLKATIAQLQAFKDGISPMTFGSTVTTGSFDGGDTNVEFLTPFVTGIVAPTGTPRCYLYAATGSDPVNGKFGCTLRDANANILCSTTSDATTAIVPGWNPNTLAGCPTLAPSTHYLFGFHKGPYSAVMAVENNSGPQSGFMASGLSEPPYPQTLTNLTPSFQMSAYLTVQ